MKNENENINESLEFQVAGHKFKATDKEGKDMMIRIIYPDDEHLQVGKLNDFLDIKRQQEMDHVFQNIRPEDVLEFVYELSNRWKDFEEMKKDLRSMIRYFKDEKFDNLISLFRPQCLK